MKWVLVPSVDALLWYLRVSGKEGKRAGPGGFEEEDNEITRHVFESIPLVGR
jgi:hypothetical protein